MANTTFLQCQEEIVAFLSTAAVNGGSADPVTIADLTVSGINLVGQAINNAKRTAQRSYDFQYAKVNAFLSIPQSGGNLSSAYNSNTLTVSGTLSPDATGTYFQNGSYNGAPFYTNVNYFTLFNTGSYWIISNSGINPTNYWSLASSSPNPAGTYTHNGSFTGSPVVSNATGAILIKNIDNVLCPINGGYVPIEFLTQETWMERYRQQIGRQPYTPANTVGQYGFAVENPVAVQQGQQIYLYLPAQFSYPVVVQLDALQFMPDYVNSGDSDFFLQVAPEYLMWQGILECNKLTKSFVERREGNLMEAELENFAQQAFQSLIEWDLSISGNTGTPAALRFQPPAQRQPSKSK